MASWNTSTTLWKLSCSTRVSQFSLPLSLSLSRLRYNGSRVYCEHFTNVKSHFDARTNAAVVKLCSTIGARLPRSMPASAERTVDFEQHRGIIELKRYRVSKLVEALRSTFNRWKWERDRFTRETRVFRKRLTNSRRTIEIIMPRLSRS